MIQYLLGSLPAAEMEEFDELSFIDDEFAVRLQVAEDELIDAYARGELAGAELAQFQAHYLISPRRREKVRFAQSFQTFAEQQVLTKTPLAAEAPPVPAIVEAPSLTAEHIQQKTEAATPWWRSLLSLFTVPNLTLQGGLAVAALVLLMVGGWLVFETIRLRSQLDQREAERAALIREAQELKTRMAQQGADRQQLEQQYRQVSERLAQLEQVQWQLQQTAPKFAFFVLAPSVRGANDTKELVIPPATETVKLRLEFESDDYPSYRAELRTQVGDQLVWPSGKLRARAKGGSKSIDLSLRASLLKPQGYRLDLKGITASGEIEDVRSYSFKVVKK